MANQNLQSIKLGAPSRIVGGAAPNAELSVQFMGLCEELTLKDSGSKCTKDGALKSGAKLLENRITANASDFDFLADATPTENIKVDIQGFGTTELTGNEINALYELLGNYTDDSYMSGNVHSGGAYEDDVQALMQRFPDLHIEAAKWYMKFKDSEVVKVLLANGIGDADGITTEQLAAVTSIGTWFRNNENVISFDELEKTNIESLISAFGNNKNLKSFTIPDSCITIVDFNNLNATKCSIERIGNYLHAAYFGNVINCGLFYANFGEIKSIFLPNVERIADGSNNIGNIGFSFGIYDVHIIDIGKKLNSVKALSQNVNPINTNVVFRKQTPPNCLVANINGSNNFYKNFFVPSSSVDLYKETSSYSTQNIKPIGGAEWIAEMQQLAQEEGYVKPDNIGWDYEYIDYLIYGCEPPTE